MPELLLELFSEEIPARFQRCAAEDLKKAVTNAMVDNGLTYESAGAFVTPRRLALTVTGMLPASPDTREERKGPRVGSPDKAVEGFLRAAGLNSIDDAKIETDPKKGEFYVAVVEKKGAPATEILAAELPKIIAGFSWAKSMRWGSGKLSWVRPLRAITATFGPENEEPETIDFEADGIAAGRTTFGHRFLSPEPIRVSRFDDYVQALEKANVVLDLDRRKQTIKADAEQLAFAQNLTIIEDEGLLEEVAGLVEWPVVLMGSFDPEYLALPEEVIIATIRANQKCFCLREGKTGGLASEVDAGSREANPTTKKAKLAPKFIITSNMAAEDGGKTIIAGNERVIRARLSDAWFFYQNDKAEKLESRLGKLKDIVFHAKLGTQAERVDRLVALTAEIAPKVGADVEEAKRAALLAKADLVTEMVGEFPELQGLMGRYYAQEQGESPAIATAMEMHYKPLGPSDQVPTEPVSIAVGLADKLDILTGFWAIGEKPTGSRDPYALRRAALGVIRTIVENQISLSLSPLIRKHFDRVRVLETRIYATGKKPPKRANTGDPVTIELLYFFYDRLKFSLKDAGARFDLVDAVISEGFDDILEITRRVESLSSLLDTQDGMNLLAGYKRGANILAAEEKKDGKAYNGAIDTSALALEEELSLARAVAEAHSGVSTHLADNDYHGAVKTLATLRAPVDAFFEAVLVNDADPAVRTNRLNLLARLRDTMHLVADFGRVEG